MTDTMQQLCEAVLNADDLWQKKERCRCPETLEAWRLAYLREKELLDKYRTEKHADLHM